VLAPPRPSHAPVPALALDLVTAAGLPLPEVFDRLDSGADGLTGAEAARRLAAIGPNAIHQRQITAIGVLLAQLRNPLLVLLLGAAAVSGFTGDPTDAIIITVIVALSVGLGFVNECRSARAVAALHADIRYKSRPSRAMIALPITCACIGALLPITPLAAPLGFTALPLAFFAILVGMVAAYLVLVEVVKRRFYARWLPAPRPPRSHKVRHVHRIHRRAARFRHPSRRVTRAAPTGT
jgi:hypothetical protein